MPREPVDLRLCFSGYIECAEVKSGCKRSVFKTDSGGDPEFPFSPREGPQG